MFARLPQPPPAQRPRWLDRFGVRGPGQLQRDLTEVLRHAWTRDRYAFDLSSAAMLRPDLSLPAWAHLVPTSGLAPIFNYFDRTGGGRGYRNQVTRHHQRDWRGGRLSYDEHDGTDLVCPPFTPLVAPAPGVVVAWRDRFLRGGLTLSVDHGEGVVTRCSHLSRILVEVGQPVRRGQALALSGHSGADLLTFFPWVPPHVHFMVWVDGRPVDPFRAPGEPRGRGCWLHGNDPETAAGPWPGEGGPAGLDDLGVQAAAVEEALARCMSAELRAEVERWPHPASRAAVLEDSLHHDRDGWPADMVPWFRRLTAAPSAALTLPLPAHLYRGAVAADTPWTRP